MNINWYPGQMAKARTNIIKKLKLIDLVVEVRDARIPDSSKNPEIDKIIGNKPRLIVLNKTDLAKDEVLLSWERFLQRKGYKTVCMSSINGKNIKKVINYLKNFKPTNQALLRRNKPVRIMVVGIPNVGKSTFINRISGRRTVRIGDRPGITKGEQWIRVTTGIELLDTPGLLWPKFDNPEVAFRLAITGAIKYEILDDYALAIKLLEFLVEEIPEKLEDRYKIDNIRSGTTNILKRIGETRGAFKAGGIVDMKKAADFLLADFRLGRLGKFTLDSPPLT